MRRLNEEKKNFLDKKVKFSNHSIKTDKLDLIFFDDVKKSNPRIKELIETAGEEYKPFPQLQEDIFSALYRYKPEKVKENRMKSSHMLNWHVMEQMMDLPRYRELRATTMHDDVSSTVGTEILSDKAYEFVKENEELRDLQDQINSAGDAASDAEKKAKEAKGKNKKDGKPGEDGEKGESIEQLTLKEAQRRLEEAKKKLNTTIKKKKYKKKLNHVLETAGDDIVETSDMIQNWGLNSSDSYTNMPYEKKMELLQRLRNSDKLKKIAIMAGKFKRIATQRQREKVKKGMDEIYSITMGKNLSRLIPQEYMKLKNPITKKLFQKDWLEGKLLQYDIKGKEKKHKGPMVCCIDNSGKDFYLTNELKCIIL